jgi:DNA-binding CsgD family transcriptional regulator
MGDVEPHIDQLLDIIGSLYESALQPSAMSVALAKLTQCTGSVGSQLFTWDIGTGRVLESRTEAEELVASHDQYRDFYGRIDPRTPVLAAQPSGSILRCHEHCNDKFVSGNEFYQDFYIPAGWRWALGGKFDSSDGTASIIAGVRAAGTPAYQDWTEVLLRRLLPHFRRANFLRKRLERSAAQSIDAERLLHSFPVGCLLLDSRGMVLSQNATAADALRDLPLRIVGGYVQFVDAALQPTWNRAVATVALNRVPTDVQVTGTQAGTWRLHLVPGSALVPARDATDLHFVLAVFELVAVSRSHKLAQLRMKFKLTAAECEVLQLLLDGVPLKRIAAKRGAQLTTVRSQVASLFDKTNYRSQRELIAAFVG